MRTILIRLIDLFGVVCCVIALSHIAFGPAIIPGASEVNATLDNEDRFYATLFLGFGAALIWCARDLDQRASHFAFLLSLFFLGGLARLVSVVQRGWPHPLFIALDLVELTLPLALWALYRTSRPAPSVESEGG